MTISTKKGALTAITYLIVCIPFIFVSCNSKKKDQRPSPYAEDSTQISDSNLKINYSSPSVKNRTIWGDLVPYGHPWRTGANEATVFSTSQDIKINGQLLAAGKYSLFTIPDNQEWIVIFNSDWDQWGAYNYEESKDALRLTVQPQKSSSTNERMNFQFVGNQLVFKWEDLTFSLDITNK